MGKAKRKPDSAAIQSITPFLAPINAIQKLLEQYSHQGVIIGGVAASLLGAPRFTADIDAVFLISTNQIEELVEAASKQGIKPRIDGATAFALKNRVLLLRHVESAIDIDLALGILPFEIEMIERSQIHQIGEVKLRLPTPEDLIITKAIAKRPKDLIDIQAIAASHPQLDKARIRYWVEQFGEALNSPSLWNDIEQLISGK